MGVASLVLGIVAAIIGCIPWCGMIALVPAIIGIVLGAVDYTKKKKAGEPKGMALAGMILSIIAVCIIVMYYFLVISVGTAMFGATVDGLEELSTNLNSMNLNNFNISITQ